MFLMLPQFEKLLNTYFLLWIEMIRLYETKYILFASKVICIQELNIFS